MVNFSRKGKIDLSAFKKVGNNSNESPEVAKLKGELRKLDQEIYAFENDYDENLKMKIDHDRELSKLRPQRAKLKKELEQLSS